MKKTTGLLAAMLAGSLLASADELVVQSFDSSGTLRFAEVTNAAMYRVEWASSAQGPWTSSWSSLNQLAAFGTGSVTASVPMLYRVVATFAPTGMGFVPAGSFIMGNATNVFAQSEGSASEVPQHTVYVSAFFIGQREVTFQEWTSVRQWGLTNGFTNSVGAGKASTHPVQQIMWYDAVVWCNARSTMENLTPVYYRDAAQTRVCSNVDDVILMSSDGVQWSANGYRLPTEAEWEKAARGGHAGHRFSWSDTDLITHSNANYVSSESITYDVSATRGNHPDYDTDPLPYTSPAGVFSPNSYQLYDTIGNVMEWCWDRYSSTYYSNSPASDPHGPVSGSYRTCRGGGYAMNASGCRVSSRWSLNSPSDKWNDTGFRVARSAY